MAPAFIITLREGLEAALIIGIVLGTLAKVGRNELRRVVWLGVFGAAGLSVLIGILLTVLGASFEGKAEEIFEGFAMLIAAGVLTWMIFWMLQQASGLEKQLTDDVQMATKGQNQGSLFMLAFVAVLREGIELALFLTAAAVASDDRFTLLGGILGLVISVIITWLLFKSLINLNLRMFFRATGILLILFAAGLVAHGVHEFNEVGWIPTVIDHVWDINHLLDEGSFVGSLLKGLFGYNGNPSLTEILAYIGYLAMVLFGVRWRNRYTLPEGNDNPT
jgi:high-affinity iron transporter